MSEKNQDSTERKEYWERYYAGQPRARLPVPSQFAVFVQGELSGSTFIVDIGCGTGRDSLFFATHDNRVVGVDGATAAVEKSKAAARELGLSVEFVNNSVGSPDLLPRLELLRADLTNTLIYARFFLHAIPENVEEDFLELASKLCRPGDHLAVEFRTVRDISLSKVTPDHYRRFIEPASFLARTTHRGFSCSYFVEGFGFAKYKADDAYVARCMLVYR
jgi:SAM-dependent methyltransferase